MTLNRRGEQPIKLPPYPQHFAASSVSTQLETASGKWRDAGASLLREVASAERALADLLDQQEARDATRQRLRNLAKGARR